jgi:phospholipid/cholesterol/gamma-HCH transport system substrate-binding protein
MDKHKKNEVKVGIVSVVGILIFIGAVILLKGISFSEKSIPVLFIFENSLGISNGSPVVVNGVKRGKVEKIYNGNGKVYIEATVNQIDDLKKDVSAIITILEITGGKKIEILPGKSDITYNSDEPIVGIPSTDLPTVINDLGNISENLVSIVIKLDTLLNKTSRVLNDDGLTNDLQLIVKNTATVTNELAELVRTNHQNIDSSVTNLAEILSNLKSAINDNKPQVETIIKELAVASKDFSKLIKQADETFAGTNKLISDADEMILDIKNSKGAINKLIYDEEFANKMDSLVISADELVKQIKEYGINANVRLGGRP